MTEMKPVTTYAAIVGAVLAQVRIAAGLTQGDLAKAIGIGPSTWSRIEKGESSLSVDQLKLASDALNISASRILELVDLAEKATVAKGISREPIGNLKWTTAAASGAIAAGFIPIVGPVLASIVGGVLAANAQKARNK
ncbi:helix-turn-helix domain-containing protein [Achromobacter spanius]|uniref:helix-turn-helix domain-containing protein n=1 Tax=Achromobacter spanius TaxID=217203 RepID=UPI000F8FA070|nr:helix-turn-helix domain-containing protein [Achromobacter spanius]AZS77611.1 helix-turn-helix domain-containing protein [Achromobacter spanius]